MTSPFDQDRLVATFGAEYHWPDELHAGPPRAAVAAVFREGSEGTELLFIQRARRESDPWSGQMAFPGGRRQLEDPTPSATAERETNEEVGLDMTKAEPLGLLTLLDGGRATNRHIIVSAHGYWLQGPPPALTANHEVADTVWVDLAQLTDRKRTVDYYFPMADATFPGIQLDQKDHVVWGLTLRMLADFFAALDQPFII